MRSEGRLDAVDGLFGFLDHAVEQNLDRHDIVHETHAHAGAEDRAVDIAVLEGHAGLLAGDDGHLLLEDVHRALAGAQAAVLDLVGEQGSVVLGHAHHAADGLLAEYGVLFSVVDDPLAVVVGDRALIDAHEAGAHGNAGSAERERGREAVAVRDAAGGDDRDLHVRGAAARDDECAHAVSRRMAADLVAGDDDAVESLALHAHGDLVVRALVEMTHAGGLDVGDEFARILGARLDSGNVLFAAQTDGLADLLVVQTLGRGEGDVDDVGLVGQAVHLVERVGKLVERRPAGDVDGADTAGVAHGGRELRHG